MTEEEWRQEKYPVLLIDGLRSTFGVSRTKAGKRRLRLYSCACLRRIWDMLEPESRELIVRLEAVCVGLEPEYNLKTLAEKADHRATFHWSADAWDPTVRNAVASAVGFRDTAQAASAVGGIVTYALLARAFPKGLGIPTEEQWKIQNDETAAQVAFLYDIFGNPFRPPSPRGFPGEVRGLAEAWLHGDTSVLPVLTDALTDLGEEAAAAHLRQPRHVRGCHVLDWILGRP